MTEEARSSLKEVLENVPGGRQQVIADCVVVLEEEVDSKRGLGGKVIKMGFGAVKKLGRGTLNNLIDMLLDEFVEELEPFYQDFLAKDADTRPSFSSFLAAQSHDVANALLNVTDRRRQRAKNKLLIKTYDGLRGKALQHVEAGVPAVGRLMQRYAFGA